MLIIVYLNEIIDLLLRWIIGCESVAANSFLLVGIKQLHASGWCWGGRNQAYSDADDCGAASFYRLVHRI